jgi:hydroxyethylthiazole kinase
MLLRKNLSSACAENLRIIAQQSPRVHCITNAVALTYTANMLLSVGATPTMSMAAGEISAFVSRADSLSINIGTLDEQRRRAIDLAIGVANEQGKPWVLDPVLVNVSPERRRYALTLLQRSPTVIRGNGMEITALAGAGEGEAAARLARNSASVVAQTSATDRITDGRRWAHIDNGHPMMARVTAMGCAGSALVAAFLAIEEDVLSATAQALLALGVAGELAAADAPGPGSLPARVLDQLYCLDAATIEAHGRVSFTYPFSEKLDGQ